MDSTAAQPSARRGLSRRARRCLLFGTLLLAGIGLYFLYPHLAGWYHWWQADRALDQNDFPAARSHLKRCLEVWPKSGKTNFLMARTCRRANDFAEARAHLLEAGRLDWDPALIRLEYLLIQAQSGIVQPIEQDLRGYLVDRPGEERIILEALVIGYLQDGSLNEAYSWSSRWVERYPDDWQGHFAQGRVLESGLRYDLAAESYQRVLDKNPAYVEAHLRRGEVLLWRGRYPEALPHFQAYRKKHPDHAGGLVGLASCQRSLSSPEVVRATLEQLFAQHPDHAGGLLVQGQLALDCDNPEEAVDWLRRAVAQMPRHMEANQALATALRLLNKEQEAQEYERVKRAIEKDRRRMEQLYKELLANPSDVSLRYEAGATLLRLGQEQQAVRLLVSALMIDPRHRETKKALADCLRQLGDPKLVEAYRRLLEDDGEPIR